MPVGLRGEAEAPSAGQAASPEALLLGRCGGASGSGDSQGAGGVRAGPLGVAEGFWRWPACHLVLLLCRHRPLLPAALT